MYNIYETVTIMSTLSPEYYDEMMKIKKSLSQYSYSSVAAALEGLTSHLITAGLIGCIIPESESNHTVLNKKEYNGNGANGTSGWNCGEGLIGWTFWKSKYPLIKKYNADSRSTQKLPETWNEYKLGKPISKQGKLFAPQDGKHIAGLTLNNQMLFLILYYDKLINELKNETDLPTIVAKIYQAKAGINFYKNISDPIERAYTTAKNKYSSSSGNHYLQSVKIAQEYLETTVEPEEIQLGPVLKQDTTTSTWLTWQNGLKNASSSVYEDTKKTISPLKSNEDVKTSGRILGTHIRQK